MSDDFFIAAAPELRRVSPGATVTYSLFAKLGSPVKETEVSARWFAINDPRVVSFSRPSIIPGPSGIDWQDAVWSVPGHHRIVCRVTHQGKTTDVTYEQWVVPLADFLAFGPQLPRLTEDPGSTLDATSRLADLLIAVGNRFPPQNQKDQEAFADKLAQAEAFRDQLKFRLASTENFVRHPVTAEHFDVKSQKRLGLRVFISQVAFDKWIIVDWTNPLVRAATGEYEGVGNTAETAVKDAVETWNSDNRYPDGGITFTIPKIRQLGGLTGSFETDGSAQWDSIATFFGWIGLGAAVVAGIATLVAPVPGSQIASAAIWTSIFSSTAAAVINIGTRIDEGFSSFRANAFDVLTIVGNLFGIGGVIWSRGATVLVQTERGLLKAALIGEVSTTGVQGVLVGVEHVERFQQIQDDPSIPPHERTGRLIELFRSAAIEGVLLYVSVKATQGDLANLNARGASVNAQTPAEKLVELANPNAEVDLTKPPKVEGSSSTSAQKTRVKVDQEMDVPPPAGRAKAVRVRTEEEAFLDAFGHSHHAAVAADLQQLRATKPELVLLTDSEVIALRGYTLDVAKPEFGGLKDFERINNALRFNDTQQLTLLAPYIKFIRSGLAKMPRFEGDVMRILNGVDPAEIRAQFVPSSPWRAPAFMSAAREKPLDHAQVLLIFKKTRSGHTIESVSKFAEREVLFPPGSSFVVMDRMELPGERFVIFLKE